MNKSGDKLGDKLGDKPRGNNMSKIDSSPNNDTLSPKDNSGIIDSADNKYFSNDVIWDISQDSSPYNEIDSPKRQKYGYTKF